MFFNASWRRRMDWLVVPKLVVAELFDAVDQPGNKAKRRQPIKRPDQAST